jgi:hypothetical protein
MSPVVLVAALALALGACGGSGSVSSTAPSTVASAPAQTSTSPASTPATTQPGPPTVPARPRVVPPRSRARPIPAHASRPSRPAAVPTSPPPAAKPHVAPKPKPKPARPAGPASHPIDETAHLVLVSSPGPGKYVQHGTVTGTFAGTMTLSAHVTNAGIAVDFTAVLPGGTVSGHGLAIAKIGRSPIATLTGTANVTGGTGTFAHVHGRNLTVAGTAVLPSGARATVRMKGTVTY